MQVLAVGKAVVKVLWVTTPCSREDGDILYLHKR
jgi:hypothetical protein